MTPMHERSAFMRAIERLRPGARYSIEGNPVHSNLKWPKQAQAKPTKQEIDAEIARTAIKERAGAVIRAAFPDWKQNNMLAAQGALLKERVFRGGWTPEEEAEAAGLETAWEWVKAVRSHSDAMEEAVADGRPVDIAAGRIDGVGGWPERS